MEVYILRMFKLKINHDNHPFCSILTEGGILKTTITHNHRILPVIYIVFHFPVCTSFFVPTTVLFSALQWL